MFDVFHTSCLSGLKAQGIGQESHRDMGDKKLWKKRRCGRVAAVLPGGHIHPKSKGAITNVHVSAVVWEKRTWCQSLLRYDTNGCGHTWDLTLVKGFNRGKKDVQKLYYSKTR